MKTSLPPDKAATKRYGDLLADIKTRVRLAQNRAVMSVNAEMLRMYWDIGRMVAVKQEVEGWGAAVIPRLAADLHNDMPEIKGFSERNTRRMIQFYNEYPHLFSIWPQAVAKLDEVVTLHNREENAADWAITLIINKFSFFCDFARGYKIWPSIRHRCKSNSTNTPTSKSHCCFGLQRRPRYDERYIAERTRRL
jgi:hypothetical protein